MTRVEGKRLAGWQKPHPRVALPAGKYHIVWRRGLARITSGQSKHSCSSIKLTLDQLVTIIWHLRH